MIMQRSKLSFSNKQRKNLNRPISRRQAIGIEMKGETMNDEILKIGKLLQTQDNHATAHPLFVVQKKCRDMGYESDYTDDYCWAFSDGPDCVIADPDEVLRLEQLDSVGKITDEEWQKVYYIDRWDFVTACFTAQSCKEFIENNKHRYGELRMFVDTAHHNPEWKLIRDYLIEQEK